MGGTPEVVGLILTSFSMTQMLATPLLGRLSDRHGRRPVILLSLAGNALAMLIFALATERRALPLLFVSRMLAGGTAGNLAACQAAVADVTDGPARAAGMGRIGSGIGLGMVVGPVLGGLTAQIDEKAPFYSVALLAAVNFAVAWLRLPESRPPGLRSPGWPELRLSLVPTPVRLVMAVHDRRIGLFLYLYFHLFSAFAVLEGLITFYVGKRFGSSALDVGLLFMWIGVVLFVTQGLLLRRLVENHLGYTGSRKAKRLLDHWELALAKFVKVIPTSYADVMARELKQGHDIRAVLPTRAQALHG